MHSDAEVDKTGVEQVPTQSSLNYLHQARITLLLRETTQDVMREVLKKIIGASDQQLEAFLHKNELLLQQILLPFEKIVLYPPTRKVSYNDLDFSLMYRIARNCCHDNLEPKIRLWGKKPPNAKRTPHAAIERLREYRNEDSHRSNAQMNTQQFQSFWNDIKSDIMILGDFLNMDSQFKEQIEQMKKMHIEPAYATLQETLLKRETELMNLREKESEYMSNYI